AVAAAVAVEDCLDHVAELLVGALRGGGPGGVVVAAAGDTKDGANRADAISGGIMDFPDHFPELGWGLVPNMTAAFFKMSFSILRRAFSRRRERRSSAPARSPSARGPALPTCVPCESSRQR